MLLLYLGNQQTKNHHWFINIYLKRQYIHNLYINLLSLLSTYNKRSKCCLLYEHASRHFLQLSTAELISFWCRPCQTYSCCFSLSTLCLIHAAAALHPKSAHRGSDLGWKFSSLNQFFCAFNDVLLNVFFAFYCIFPLVPFLQVAHSEMEVKLFIWCLIYSVVLVSKIIIWQS